MILIFESFGSQPGPTYESTVSYSYDAGNRLTQAVDSISGTVTLGYDDLDRLTSETTPAGTVSYTYDAAGRRLTMSVPNQSQVSYTYDDANRLTRVAQGSSGVDFSYDNADRRTTLTLPNGIVTSYTYDDASELTQITYTSGQSTLGTLTYSYDLSGNRVAVGGSFARTGLPSAVATAAHNAANQLTAWGTSSLTYDANGNLTSDGTHSYTWSARNALAAIDSGNTAAFVYDAFGRRRSKTMGGGTTSFVYDRPNVVQEVFGSGSGNSLTGLGIDEVFQRTDAAGARIFLTDALGSTVALADSTATIQTQYTYEPFGQATVSGTGTTFSFTGRELDATGLYYYRARYYDPRMGRFLSEDPIRFNGGINFYTYVNNNPVTSTDPFGLLAWGTWGAGVSGAIGGPKGAALADASCIVVEDAKGNKGVLCCWGGGVGVTYPLGGNVGVQGTGALCLNCKTICDMPGFYGGAQAGGSVAGGMAGTFGGSSTATTMTIIGGAGPAAGAGYTAGAVAGNCRLIFTWPIKCGC